MTTSEKTGDIEIKRFENTYPETRIILNEEVNVLDAAYTIYKYCREDMRLYNLDGDNEVDCIVKTAKAEYKIHISTPHNFENLFKEVAKQILI